MRPDSLRLLLELARGGRSPFLTFPINRQSVTVAVPCPGQPFFPVTILPRARGRF